MVKATTRILAPATLLGVLLASSPVLAFTLNVVDPDGTPVPGFRWLLEEDNSHDPQPGVHRDVFPGMPEANTLAVSIHKSHAPVVGSGESGASSASVDTTAAGVTPLPDGRYVLSVLPYSGFTLGGTTVEISGGSVSLAGGLPPLAADTVTVYVKANPIETAQLAIKVFHDVLPLNNAPDPTEQGLEGFRIELMDNGGDIVEDAFGNKLGTTYVETCDANGENPGSGTSFCLDSDGAPVVDVEGPGTYLTDANGEVIIKYLRPNKYGINAKPPGGQTGWYQTTTIEGKPTIDAWVGPKEPPFLVEFGPPFWHAFYGFVQETDRLDEINPDGDPTSTISGQVLKGHQSRPPAIAFFDGAAPSTSPCLIGLNRIEAGLAEAVWVGVCEDEGIFSIPGVPPGSYQVVAFDLFLDQIISFSTVIVDDAGGSIDLGTLPVPMWFGEHEHYVYFDADRDGVRDPGEPGMPEQNVNLRFRDGSIYSAFPTDSTGYVPFEEVFPFFRFLVAEVDYLRFLPTGLAAVNDDGGLVTNDQYGEGKRNPIVDVQQGPVLTQAFQTFAGQNQRWEWGKSTYDGDVNVAPLDDFPGPGDTDQLSDGIYNNNGGIAGIVFYAVTRAEDDPRFAAGEEWETGIPRVQVNLYRDKLDNQTGAPTPFGDGIADPADPGSASFPYAPVGADVDNYPLGWSNGGTRGPEDVDHDDDGVYDLGDAILTTHTDSWDDNLPSGCVGSAAPLEIHGTSVPISDCSEGLRTWNQQVPGLFDGGYAFGSLVSPDEGNLLVPGVYIVEAAAPPGYRHVKEEDRNVDFGDTPIPFILPAPCVGDEHTVPDLFSFLTEADNVTPLPGVDPLDPENEAPFAGQLRRLCDRKKVQLSTGQNGAADFFMFTDVPRAARLVGGITDDFANELAPGKPGFVEKFSPAWLPVSIRDYTGKEIIRTYADEFGAFNALLPSTYNIDLPTPTGVGPQMTQVCLNDPGPDVNNPDPRHRDQYSVTCYQFDFWPGKTTYLDTPVIRTAAFVGALQSSLDCELLESTPMIREVIGTAGRPAYVDGGGDTFTIESMGTVQVRNPRFPGDANMDLIGDDPPTEPEFVPRDFGFGGAEGEVWIGDYQVPANAVTWTDSTITVDLPNNAIGQGLVSGQLRLVKPARWESLNAVTLTVGDTEPASMAIHEVEPGESIQAAIDAADEDDLILVHPGSYHENVIIYKRVRVQGAGAGSTVLNATHFPGQALNAWRTKLAQLVADGDLGLLPGQETVEPLFRGQEGPGVLVAPPDGVFNGAGSTNARFDGFTVRSADQGGGILVNAWAYDLEIGNNRIANNSGTLGGGIRIGNPLLSILAGFPQELPPSPNPGVRIHDNHILENGSQATGGGIAIFSGADDYAIEDNNLCGNFSRQGGGAIGHTGLSDNALIARNDILFNEVFQGDQLPSVGGGGGGIEIAGEAVVDELGNAILTPGSGTVTIDRNKIQGNLGGADDGGGIRVRNANGQDALTPSPHEIRIFNNFLVNNATGAAGGGISLQDAIAVKIMHNTVARNDAAAVAVGTFGNTYPNGPTTPQVAGIVSRAHGLLLEQAVGEGFSNPQMVSNLVWENRTFLWTAGGGLEPRAVADGGPYWDLGVVPDTAGSLTCTNCLGTGDVADPFMASYENVLRTAAAADEGGNFVQLLFSPIGLFGNYHIATSLRPAPGGGQGFPTPNEPELDVDIDGDPRFAFRAHRGADRSPPAPPPGPLCGFGPELAGVLPLLWWLHMRRLRRREGCEA